MSFSKEIIEILDYLGKQLGIAIDWSAENVMPYLQDLMGRFVGFKMAESGIWIAIIILLIILNIYIFKKGIKLYKEYNQNYNYDYFMSATILWVISGVLLFFLVPFLFNNILKIVECYFLPEKIVYEYIQTLLPK